MNSLVASYVHAHDVSREHANAHVRRGSDDHDHDDVARVVVVVVGGVQRACAECDAIDRSRRRSRDSRCRPTRRWASSSRDAHCRSTHCTRTVESDDACSPQRKRRSLRL